MDTGAATNAGANTALIIIDVTTDFVTGRRAVHEPILREWLEPAANRVAESAVNASPNKPIDSSTPTA